MVKAIALSACLVVLSSPALSANWTITKNEQDPFDKEKATFVAATIENGRSFAVRCLEGELSFAITLGPGAGSQQDEFELRIVADGKNPIDASGAVLGASVFGVGVQFGNVGVMDYLQGAKKYWLRVSGPAATETIGFTGGRSFDDMMNRARKACGEAPEPAPVPSPTHQAIASIPPKWASKDCSRETSCSNQIACLTARHELGDDPDYGAYSHWCMEQPGMKP